MLLHLADSATATCHVTQFLCYFGNIGIIYVSYATVQDVPIVFPFLTFTLRELPQLCYRFHASACGNICVNACIRCISNRMCTCIHIHTLCSCICCTSNTATYHVSVVTDEGNRDITVNVCCYLSFAKAT